MVKGCLAVAMSLFVLAASVSEAQEPPVVKKGFTLEKKEITERRIPTYILFADEFATKKKPAVILIHGGAMLDERIHHLRGVDV